MNLRDFLQIKDAAKILGISPSTLRNWERNGKITVYRHPVNQYRLYKISDLEALLGAIETSSGVQKGLATENSVPV